MNDLFEKAFGSHLKKESDEFDLELLDIQEKYKKWFEENIEQEEQEEKRSILYYKVLYINPPTVAFKLDIDNLPEQIRHECHEKFQEIFADKKS